jgi:peptidoglycan/LPS O-acetylase OafA/YrhL
VLSHFEQWNAMAGHRACNENILAVGSYAVYVFFVISGFIIAYTHRKDFGKSGTVYPYVIKRIFRIYPAYLVFSFLNVIAAWAGMQSWDINGHLHRSSSEMISALTLIPVALQNSNCSFLAVGWSLFYELVFYIVFSLFFFNRKIGWFTLGFFSVVSIMNGLIFAIDCFWLSRASVLFGVGCLLGFFANRLHMRLAVARGISAGGAFFFVVALGFRERSHSVAVSLFALAAVLLVVGAVAADLNRTSEQPGLVVQVMAWIGTNSYSLYISHVLVQGMLFAFIGAPQTLVAGILFFVVPVGCAALGNRFIERPAQKLARRITADRGAA